MADNENKPKALDLNEISLVDEEPIEIDPEADAFATPAPPPDGTHLVKLKLFRQGSGDSGFTIAKDKNDNEYIQARLEARIVAEGQKYDNAPVFDRVNTIIMQSTGTCSMAGVLRALKVPVPSRVSKRDLARTLATALEGEPLVKIETQWQIREEQSDGKWKTVLKGMKKFPPKKDGQGNVIPGEHEHVVDGNAAQATVLRYLPA